MITGNMSTAAKGVRIQAVIFDWAGTTIDYGCFAPVEAFIRSFRKYGIEPDIDEVRGPMGLPKREHVKQILSIKRIVKLWTALHGSEPAEKDVDSIYGEFDSFLKESVRSHIDIKPFTLETIETLRKSGLKIGSTTGYTGETMEMILPDIRKKGYSPDVVVTPDNLPAGRPYPWMCYSNAMKLNVYPMSAIVKVGDTVSDILEGVNSGCWSVGVINGSSEMGLSLEEEKSLLKDQLKRKRESVAKTFISNGAHYVIDDLSEIEEVIQRINSYMGDKSL